MIPMDDEDFIVTVNDVLKAGHCIVPGLRDWCKTHGFDLRTFVKTGYPASVLLQTGDAFAERVINLKRIQNGR